MNLTPPQAPFFPLFRFLSPLGMFLFPVFRARHPFFPCAKHVPSLPWTVPRKHACTHPWSEAGVKSVGLLFLDSAPTPPEKERSRLAFFLSSYFFFPCFPPSFYRFKSLFCRGKFEISASPGFILLGLSRRESSPRLHFSFFPIVSHPCRVTLTLDPVCPLSRFRRGPFSLDLPVNGKHPRDLCHPPLRL